MLLKARWVIPIISSPIENGAILIDRNRIEAVGLQKDFLGKNSEETIDLGNTVLFPGLVNAHCHLEFSNLRGKIKPGDSFTEWVRKLGKRLDPRLRGDDRIIQGGTTTLADHCHPENLKMDPRLRGDEGGVRRIPFWEVLGADRERAAASLKKALERASTEGGYVTPHSLYAVNKKVLAEIFNNPSSPPLNLRGGRVGLSSIHLLESADEDQFFRSGSGPLADYVLERGGVLPSSGSSLLKYILPSSLVVHGNYLNSDEIDLLSRLECSVIHCPGSHRFFGHRRFPLEEIQKRGILIALGTDSLASNDDLSMLREMRLLKETYPALANEEILGMATINGAKALKIADQVGSLEKGKSADIVTVPWMGGDPYEAIFRAEKVSFSMIGGVNVPLCKGDYRG